MKIRQNIFYKDLQSKVTKNKSIVNYFKKNFFYLTIKIEMP